MRFIIAVYTISDLESYDEVWHHQVDLWKLVTSKISINHGVHAPATANDMLFYTDIFVLKSS